jgi:alanine-glyoxylate transaminase/serine-glyoxylate transaminase/serine-pyruvate transaminase
MRVADIAPRTLLGPGPSDTHPRVLEAMARPTIGYLDPQLFALLDDIQDMLRAVFKTSNELTLAVSGTGMAGMETCLANLLEPGDRLLVGVAGFFGQRLVQVAQRLGAEVCTVEVPWGEVISGEQMRQALQKQGPVKLVAVVNGETSTGAWQPIPEIAEEAHAAGAMLLVDAVTTLGGVPVLVDEWGIDACYSGSQKCLSCPPGLSPVTFGPAARAAMARRKRPVSSFYLDMDLLGRYWGRERQYHHTIPVNMIYALHEALVLVLQEGLEARWARHLAQHQALKSGVEALGLRLTANPAHLLPSLNVVATPEGVDEGSIRQRLLEDEGIEIGGGLGALKGKAWRIGLMGEGARPEKVQRLLAALGALLGG